MISWGIAMFFNNIEIIPIGCIFFFVFLYIHMTKKWELFWFFLYSFFCVYFVMVLLFYYEDVILMYFLDQVLEPIIISDPTIFVYNYFYFVIYLSLLLSLPFFFYGVGFLISSITYRYNYSLLKYIPAAFMYILSIVFWITKYDLFFSNWFSLAYKPKLTATFDFQPHFENFLNTFWDEYQEVLFFYLCLSWIPFLFILRGRFTSTQKGFHLERFFFGFHVMFIFYFFFEFFFLSNVLVFSFFFLFFFFFRILWFILDLSRRFKKETFIQFPV